MIKYNEQYDAYYDDTTGEWTESKCDDPTCDYCKDRPRYCKEPNGTPYISIHDRGDLFAIRLHRYDNIFVTLDKRVIPQLIEQLQDMVATEARENGSNE
jgi:hypothetical protein